MFFFVFILIACSGVSNATLCDVVVPYPTGSETHIGARSYCETHHGFAAQLASNASHIASTHWVRDPQDELACKTASAADPTPQIANCMARHPFACVYESTQSPMGTCIGTPCNDDHSLVINMCGVCAETVMSNTSCLTDETSSAPIVVDKKITFTLTQENDGDQFRLRMQSHAQQPRKPIVTFHPLETNIREMDTCASSLHAVGATWPQVCDASVVAAQWTIENITATSHILERTLTLDTLGACRTFDNVPVVSVATVGDTLVHSFRACGNLVQCNDWANEDAGAHIEHSSCTTFRVSIVAHGSVISQYGTHAVDFHVHVDRTFFHTTTGELYVVLVTDTTEDTLVTSPRVHASSGTPAHLAWTFESSGAECYSKHEKCRQVWVVHTTNAASQTAFDTDLVIDFALATQGVVHQDSARAHFHLSLERTAAIARQLTASVKAGMYHDHGLHKKWVQNDVFYHNEKMRIRIAAQTSSIEPNIDRVLVCCAAPKTMRPYDATSPRDTGCYSPGIKARVDPVFVSGANDYYSEQYGSATYRNPDQGGNEIDYQMAVEKFVTDPSHHFECYIQLEYSLHEMAQTSTATTAHHNVRATRGTSAAHEHGRTGRSQGGNMHMVALPTMQCAQGYTLQKDDTKSIDGVACRKQIAFATEKPDAIPGTGYKDPNAPDDNSVSFGLYLSTTGVLVLCIIILASVLAYCGYRQRKERDLLKAKYASDQLHHESEAPLLPAPTPHAHHTHHKHKTHIPPTLTGAIPR